MNISWKSASKGEIPKGAIVAGFESNGTPLFLCRAKFGKGMPIDQGLISGKGMVPGKVRKEFGAANVGLAGKEVKMKDYEVYCGGAKWEKASNGNIPTGAIVVGNEPGGAPLYAARAEIRNGLHPGKVRPEFKGAMIPFGNIETLATAYEILVEK